MADLGYGSEVIDGTCILAGTCQAYDTNQTEDDETTVVYAAFFNAKIKPEDIINIYRKKAKVVFCNDSLILDKLAISGAMPRTYIKWVEALRNSIALP